MIQLTQYKDGLPVFIAADEIKLIQQCPAYSCEITGSSGSERTRIDTAHGQILLVKESAVDVNEMRKAAMSAESEATRND